MIFCKLYVKKRSREMESRNWDVDIENTEWSLQFTHLIDLNNSYFCCVVSHFVAGNLLAVEIGDFDLIIKLGIVTWHLDYKFQ